MGEQRFSVLVECSEETPLTKRVIEIADALGFTVTPGYSLSTLTASGRRERLEGYDGIGLIFEGHQNGPMRESLVAVLHACQMRKKGRYFVVSNEGAVPDPEIESVEVAGRDLDEQYRQITHYLNNFRSQLQGSDLNTATKYPYVRDYVKREIDFQRGGNLLYKTAVQVTCLQDGVSDFHHSFDMRHGLHLPADGINPKIEFTSATSSDRKFSIEKVLTDPTKFGLRVFSDFPLKRGDSARYGWESTFRHSIPENSVEAYSTVGREIEHHFFISRPTKELELKICIFDKSLVGDCRAAAFSGRTLDPKDQNDKETQRIAALIHAEDFNQDRRIALRVPSPHLQFSYTLLWTYFGPSAVNAKSPPES